MRLDRQLTLLFFEPVRRLAARSGEYSLPVMMYHSISDDPEPGVRAYYRVSTSPSRFAEHLQWLNDSGYSGVSLEEAMGMPEEERKRRRPVVLTFDDGLLDFYQTAWPMLCEAGCTATMYLPTGFVAWPRRQFRDRACLTWDEVREMRSSGIRFGSHTVSHRKLYEMPWRELAEETLDSKRKIERELGEQIESFAYPFAFPQEDAAFVALLSEILQGQGYRSCATTVIGRQRQALGDDGFYVKRLPANNCDDRALWHAKLNGHYDWMAGAQRLVRHLRRRRWCTKTAR